MTEKKNGVGVIVGRFQTPWLTKGHTNLIDQVREKHDRVIIFIGVNPVPSTKRNPLDYQTRETMIVDYAGDVTILPVMDNPSDEVWSKNLDSMIRAIVPFGKVFLYGGRDSFIPRYHGKLETIVVDSVESTSATEIREIVASNFMNDQSFREGVIYSVYNSFPRVNPTVDIAIVRDYPRNPGCGHLEILLGKKPGEKLWRFPGGFVDKGESFEQAAIREAHEETGLIVENPRYIGSFSLNDWRVTEGNSMVTSLFVARHTQGHAEAGDDLEQVEWFIFNNLLVSSVNDNHKTLMNALLDRKNGLV